MKDVRANLFLSPGYLRSTAHKKENVQVLEGKRRGAIIKSLSGVDILKRVSQMQRERRLAIS
jgi:hypothetical protein